MRDVAQGAQTIRRLSLTRISLIDKLRRRPASLATNVKCHGELLCIEQQIWFTHESKYPWVDPQ
jgi:hypothetical protein